MSDALPTDGELDPGTLARRLRAGEAVSVLDVRDRDEYETWHVEGRTVSDAQVPHAKFIAASARGDPADLLPEALAEPVVVVCPRGKASAEVAEMLRGAGVDAVNLAGGMTAWARTYPAVELPVEGATVLQYQRPSTGCLAYLVVSDGEAAVVDPLRAFADRYPADATDRDADLRYAVDTHVHADHVSGVRDVAAVTDAEAVLPAGAADRGLAFDARLVEDGDRLEVGDVTLEAVHAPGHTSELTAFRLRGVDPGALFTGDALFLRSVGRPDLERGADAAREHAEREYDSLHDRLLALPDDTLVAPGHYADPSDARGGSGNAAEVDARGGSGDSAEVDARGGHGNAAEVDSRGEHYAAPLSDLRELDVLGLDREAFLERVATDLPPRPANHERIVATNLGRESMDDDEAFEAELGPNNCAVG